MAKTPVTVWRRYNKKDNGGWKWEHNHISNGYNKSIKHPIAVNEEQKKSWKGSSWLPFRACLNNGKLELLPIPQDYLKYVDQYTHASKLLTSNREHHFPAQQTRGLLLELTLKAYLCACEIDLRGHNLENLTKKACENGLKLESEDMRLVIKPINEIYFEGGPWDHRYLSRYPKPDSGIIVTITPTHEMVHDVVQRIIEQAMNKIC